MRIHQIAAALDATLIEQADSPWNDTCDTCGSGLHRPADQPRRLCRRCTEVEVGETAEDLSRRLGRKMTRKAYEALPRDNDGRPVLPTLTWRQWRRLLD